MRKSGAWSIHGGGSGFEQERKGAMSEHSAEVYAVIAGTPTAKTYNVVTF